MFNLHLGGTPQGTALGRHHTPSWASPACQPPRGVPWGAPASRRCSLHDMTAPCWPSPQPPSPGIPGPDGVSGGTVTPGPVGLYLSARMVFLDYWGPYEGVALHAQSNARVPQILATCR